MSKNPAPKKKRKTRMTGTDALRPCVQCKELKPRFTAFKPRWAGCDQHKTERGRRYYQEGCAACDAKVNGNIRQPRCIECDKSRSKKRKPAAPKPTKVEAPKVEAPKVEPTPEPTPEPVAAEPEPTPEPKPVVVEARTPTLSEALSVEPKAEPSPASVDATPEPTQAPARPKIASMADLSKLFGEG
jgi:hypothetical protein